MSETIKHSNCVYFHALRDSLSDPAISNENRIQSINEKIKFIRRGEGGHWPLPNAELTFIKTLEELQLLFELKANRNVTSQYCNDFIQSAAVSLSKCKIVFFAQEVFVWPCVEHLYRAAAKDERFEAQVVYVPFSHNNATQEDNNLQTYSKMGIPAVNYTEYNLSKENPEVAVFVKPYNNIPAPFFMREVEKIARRTIYVPYGLEMTKDLIRYAFHEYVHYRAWRHLAYGEIVKELGQEHGYRNGENIAVWGHPRVDNYLGKQRYSMPSEWRKKIKGRKVVLWCPHHTIKPGPECVSTWLDYYQDVFRLFEERNDVVLLWRPHPLLFGAIVNNGYMTKKELDAFIEHQTSRDNVILDQTDDYRIAFAVSDAIITDGTTFSLEYLLTGKPLMLTAHKLDQFYNCEELAQAVYWGKKADDIACFLTNVANGRDPLKNARETFKKKTFFIPKGQNVSQYILDKILVDITEEEKNNVVRWSLHESRE